MGKLSRIVLAVLYFPWAIALIILAIQAAIQ